MATPLTVKDGPELRRLQGGTGKAGMAARRYGLRL